MLANHAPASNDSPQGDSAQSASDYETILAALTATARGRAFLREYARRVRVADTDTLLNAIGRIEHLLTSRALEPDAPAATMNGAAVAAMIDEPGTVPAPVANGAAAPVATTDEPPPAEPMAPEPAPSEPALKEPTPRESKAVNRTSIDPPAVAFTIGSIAGFEPVQPSDPVPPRRDPFADILALSDVEKIALFT